MSPWCIDFAVGDQVGTTVGHRSQALVSPLERMPGAHSRSSAVETALRNIQGLELAPCASQNLSFTSQLIPILNHFIKRNIRA